MTLWPGSDLPPFQMREPSSRVGSFPSENHSADTRVGAIQDSQYSGLDALVTFMVPLPARSGNQFKKSHALPSLDC